MPPDQRHRAADFIDQRLRLSPHFLSPDQAKGADCNPRLGNLM
jgi:hypothetical protein